MIAFLLLVSFLFSTDSTSVSPEKLPRKSSADQLIELTPDPDDFFKLKPPEKTTVWVLIVDPGKTLFSSFGHSAFLIRYPDGNEKVYDFGNFEITDGFMGKVIKNSALYSVESQSFGYFLDKYKDEQRTVRGLRLNLPEKRVAFLIKRLETIVNSSEHLYKYKHFNNNCTTKMRDVLAQTIKGTFREELERRELPSWRISMNKILEHSFWLKSGLNFLLASKADQPRNGWDGAYLPELLEKELLTLKIADSPFGKPEKLVNKYMVIIKGKHWDFKTPGKILGIIATLLFLIIAPIIVWRYGLLFKFMLFMFSLLQTALFIVLLIMHIYHPVSSFNLNFAAVFPVLLLFFPFWKNTCLKSSNTLIKILIISIIPPFIEIVLRTVTIQKTFPYPDIMIAINGIFLAIAVSIRLDFKKSIVKMTKQLKTIAKHKS